MKSAKLILGTLLLIAPSTAQAHNSIVSHTSRHTSADQKVGPCGRADTQRGSKVYTYEPGETIAIEISEDIPHPGWFRIAFDNDGTDDLLPPKSIDPPSFMDSDAVLADNLDPDMHSFALSHTPASTSSSKRAVARARSVTRVRQRTPQLPAMPVVNQLILVRCQMPTWLTTTLK